MSPNRIIIQTDVCTSLLILYGSVCFFFKFRMIFAFVLHMFANICIILQNNTKFCKILQHCIKIQTFVKIHILQINPRNREKQNILHFVATSTTNYQHLRIELKL